jgi:hypothetical protein
MGVTIMKLPYLYLLIGVLTLVLNIALTFNIIRKNAGMNRKDTWECEDLITFKVAGGSSTEGATEAVACEDTLPLE